MASRDDIDVTQHDNVKVITLSERFKNIDEPAVQKLQSLLLDLANDASPPRVTVDLANVDFFGSSFIEVLFRMWNRVHQNKGRFAVAGMTEYCKEVIQVTRLDQLWHVTETVEEAVAYCKSDD